MNLLSPKAALMMPGVISFIMLMISYVTSPNPTYLTLICFLPVLFFLVGNTTVRYVAQLEKRVADLEKRGAIQSE